MTKMRGGSRPEVPAQPGEPEELGPFLSPYGLILQVPRPLGPGTPAPEPDERWTLVPGREAGSTEPPPPDAPAEQGDATTRRSR